MNPVIRSRAVSGSPIRAQIGVLRSSYHIAPAIGVWGMTYSTMLEGHAAPDTPSMLHQDILPWARRLVRSVDGPLAGTVPDFDPPDENVRNEYGLTAERRGTDVDQFFGRSRFKCVPALGHSFEVGNLNIQGAGHSSSNSAPIPPIPLAHWEVIPSFE